MCHAQALGSVSIAAANRFTCSPAVAVAGKHQSTGKVPLHAFPACLPPLLCGSRLHCFWHHILQYLHHRRIFCQESSFLYQGRFPPLRCRGRLHRILQYLHHERINKIHLISSRTPPAATLLRPPPLHLAPHFGVFAGNSKAGLPRVYVLADGANTWQRTMQRSISAAGRQLLAKISYLPSMSRLQPGSLALSRGHCLQKGG